MLMKNNFQSKAVPRGTRTIWRYLGALFLLFTFAIGQMWGAAPVTSSDSKTVSGTVTFADVTTLTAQTTYWYNGVKLYSYATSNQNANNSLWTGKVSSGTYYSSITAGSSWGSYAMSGLVLAQHAVAAHVKGAGTVTVVVNNNRKDYTTFDSNFKAYRVAANTYGNSYTTSNYKQSESGTEITSALNISCESGKGRYTVSFDVTEEMLDANDEVIIKFLYGSSGTGAGKWFCYESVTFTPETPSCSTEITTQPSDASLAKGDANPELSIVATNADSYAWKESSDGTSYDGSSTLSTSASYTPEVNDAVQTKYYYCEVTSDCDGTTVVKSDIVTVEVVASIVHVTDVSLDKTSQEFTLGATTTTTLTATVAPNEATNKAVSWESSAPTKVSVTDNGDGTAEIEALAEGTATITVTTDDGSYTATCDVTVHPDPCHKYFWFSKAADATTAGVTNNEGSFFTTSASGSNSASSSITIDEVEYAITNRTGNIGADDATIVSFTIPANKAGTFYTNMASSGNKGESSSRTLYLKKGGVTVVTATNAIYGDGAQHNATIENIPSGTYTLHANNNVKVGMFAVKACDATYHTITLDLDGGTGTTSVAAIDGVPAYKPADPTKEHADFVKWVVKSTEADYNWSANVTGDLTLKAVWSNWPTLTLAAGEGATGDPIANKYKAGTEITVPEKPEGFSKGTDVFTGWAYSQTVTVTDGKFDMPSTDLTLTAQWQAPSDFDVKFFQGYGEPDVQIGETQSISTGNFAVAPADPERAGFAFLGWSYDATEAHIVDVATYGITAATNFTAMWKAVWTVTFDGAGAVNVEDGETVASPDSPTQAGKVFQGWYNGESKYDFSAAVTGNLALESKWAAADPNHFYYTYNDDFHFDGVVYKTPEGKTTDPEADEATLNLTTPYTVYSGAEGITSIIATNGIYDYKKGTDTKHVTAYLKLKRNDGTSNLAFTIKSGYTAVLKIKMGGYSNNPVVTLKKGDDAVPATSGTIGGTATGKNYNEITYNLTAGTYVMTSADQTLYISHIDLEATALPTHSVTYKPGDGEGAWVVDADATEVADCPGTFTAPAGKVFNGWKNESDDSDVAVGAIVEDDMNLIAQWINVYAVTFNMNDHGDAPAAQNIKHGEKATKPADPIAIGWDFGGWFTDNGTFEAPFDFNTPITAATPLFAKWTADPCPDKKSIVKAVMATNTTATVTGYNSNEYAGGFIINNLADDASNTNMYDFGEGEVKGFKLKGSNSAIFATLAKGGFVAGDQVVFAVTKNAGDNKLAIYAAKDKDNVLKLVELDVAAAGIYTYRLTQDNVDAIEAAGSGYLSIGTFRGDYNPYIYSVELKGCREWAIFHTLTFKNIDGTATIAAESLEEGAYASTVAPVAPKIAMKRFLGWAEAVDGTPVDLTSYTITEDKTLYAVYEDIVCPTNGTVYKFEIKDELPSENLPTSTDKDMSSYITATGDGYLTYTATANNKATINSDGTIQMKDASAAYLKVELECALAAGDQIRAHVSGNPIRVQVGTTYDSDKDLILAKDNYVFVDITSAMVGKKVLYIARSTNGNANLADFEIYRRPALTGASLADLTMRQGQNKTPELTLEPSADAIVTSQVWEIVGEPTNLTGAAINGTTGVITTGTLNNPANNGTISVKVTLNGGSIEATCTVTVVDAIVQADVTKSTIWDWHNTGATANIQLDEDSDPKKNENFVLANVAVNNNADFESDKLVVEGEYMVRDYDKTNPYFQGQTIKFNTTVAGVVRVKFSHTGNATAEKPARELYVNGVATGDVRNSATAAWSRYVEVPAGEVVITAYYVDLTPAAAQQYIRVSEIEFLEKLDSRTEYAAGELGTACYEYDAVVIGATPYMVAGVNGNGYIVFDEITSGVIDAGYPYLFEATGGKVFFCKPVGTTAAPLVSGEETSVNGMIGTFSGTTLTQGEDDICYFAGRHIWRVNDFSVNIDVDPHRCYVNYDVLRTKPAAAAAAPGRRRVIMGVNGKDEAQGFENLESGDAPMKIMIDGTLYILRGEKVFDATGRLVK